jgi:hypothetical protein
MVSRTSVFDRTRPSLSQIENYPEPLEPVIPEVNNQKIRDNMPRVSSPDVTTNNSSPGMQNIDSTEVNIPLKF